MKKIIRNETKAIKERRKELEITPKELASVCDLISTAIYPTLDSKFSFKIGDVSTFTSIGAKAIAKEEKKLGIKNGTLVERMNIVYQKIVDHQDEIIKEMNSEFPKAKIHR
jgi:hypothetical protein